MKTIVKNLKEVLAEKQNDGFELFITGHSLGGALCQLLSFELASYSEIGEKDPFPLPIRAITFASPQLGNKEGFAQAYQALEKADRVRHLRATNQGDVVPEGLSVLVTLKLESMFTSRKTNQPW
jgi:predicted lipase